MQKIVIIGTGNVAEHLSDSFFKKGFLITQIWGRNKEKAEILAKKVHSESTSVFHLIKKNADLYLLCISDDAVSEIVQKIDFEPSIIVHTAGSLPLEILNKFKNHGVFYPLQTFTKGRELSLKNVPFCLEANNKKTLTELKNIAGEISDNIIEMNSLERKRCHLSAIFACNFTNYFYSIASELLAEKNLSLNLLKPLIEETLAKATSITPQKAQTGPAVRGDWKIINKHLDELKNEDWKKLYSFVSESIFNYHKR